MIFLDTYAMVEIFEGNEKYLAYKSMGSVTTRFNLFEFYYVVLAKYGKEKADIVFKNYKGIAKEVNDEKKDESKGVIKPGQKVEL